MLFLLCFFELNDESRCYFPSYLLESLFTSATILFLKDVQGDEGGTIFISFDKAVDNVLSRLETSHQMALLLENISTQIILLCSNVSHLSIVTHQISKVLKSCCFHEFLGEIEAGILWVSLHLNLSIISILQQGQIFIEYIIIIIFIKVGMKLTQVQQISLNRVKKKPGSYTMRNSKQCNIGEETDFSVNSETNYSSVNNITERKTIGIAQPIQISLSSQKSEVCMLKNKNILQKLSLLEIQNCSLSRQNSKMKLKIQEDEKQKVVLKERVNKFEKDLQAFKQQCSSKKGKKKIILQNKSTNSRHRSINLRKGIIERQNGNSRRMSLQEEVGQLSTKLKEYKNLLQLQKIKKANLEKQLRVSKENYKLQTRRDKQFLQIKIKNLKEALQRKNEEIKQKQSIIQTLIHR